MKERIYIYSLSAPTDPDIVRYIGQAENIEIRLSAHISQSLSPGTGYKSLRNQWLRSLQEKGMRPIMRVLHETTKEEANDLEEKVIREYRLAGANLVNAVKNMPVGSVRGSGGKPSFPENLTIRISTDMRAELEEQADTHAITIGMIVREALEEWLAKNRTAIE